MSGKVISLKDHNDSENDQRPKWMAASGVFVLLFSVALVNYQFLLNSDSADEESRKLASLSGVAVSDSDWEQWLSMKDNIDRELASIGHRPSAMDRLTAGVLEGKYLVKFDAGKIKSLEFTDLKNDRPKYIRNRAGFIESYKSLMPAGYASLKLTEDMITTDRITEVYTLFDSSSKELAKVEFKMDQFGRLISLKVQ